MASEHLSFSNSSRNINQQFQDSVLKLAKQTAEETTLLIMQKNKKLDLAIADSIVSKVMGEIEESLSKLREISNSLANQLEETKHLLDVILVDAGPEPIHIIRELKNRDIASLAELKEAMDLGQFKVSRNLEWKEANELAKKLSFWKAEVLIVPSGIEINLKKNTEKKKKKYRFRR